MTLATIVLATATVSARHVSKLRDKPTLAKSFEADPDDWSDEDFGEHGPVGEAEPMVLDERVATSPTLRCDSVTRVPPTTK